MATRAPLKIVLVETLEGLRECCLHAHGAAQLSLDVEALQPVGAAREQQKLGAISLIQISAVERSTIIHGNPAAATTYLIDALALGLTDALSKGHTTDEHDLLKALLERDNQQKMLYDFRGDFVALQEQAGIELPRLSLVDVQLMYSAKRWLRFGSNHRQSLDYALHDVCGIPHAETQDLRDVKQNLTEGKDLWETRPIPLDLQRYAATGAASLPLLWNKLMEHHEQGKVLTRYTRVNLVSGFPSPEMQLIDTKWLTEVVGPAGACPKCRIAGHSPDMCHLCAFCQKPGHSEDQCTLKKRALEIEEANGPPQYKKKLHCTFCGSSGHDEDHCYKKHPPVCTHCGEKGHTARVCRHLIPCWKCGKTGHLPHRCIARDSVIARQS